jgi:hypothetical protein
MTEHWYMYSDDGGGGGVGEKIRSAKLWIRQ